MQRRENIASPSASTGRRLSNGRTPPAIAAHDARGERLRLEATRKALLLRQCVSGRARNALTPRYDLRRRVLETNLVRESKCQTAQQQPGDLVISTAPKPAQPTPRSFRRWGYCDASIRADATQARSRLECRVRAPQRSPAPAEKPQPSTRPQLTANSSPLNATRCGTTWSPRKLGSPRNFAVVSAAAIKKRLRRSWSYREAIAGDAPSDEQQEAQAPYKRLKMDALASTAEVAAATNTRPVLSKRPCRVQHGKPFPIPTPPAITPASTKSSPRSVLSSQPQQLTRIAITPHAFTASPAAGHCVSFPGTLATPSARTTTTAPHATWALSPALCHNGQAGVVTPTVTPCHQHLGVIMPLSPSVVSQGTQTSPKRLRRRSSLKRAFERLLSSGKENEANASQQSVSKNAKVKVKRRPSLVESLLFRRSSNDNESQSKPGRHSTDYAGASKNIVGSSPRRNKPRRAHSLQMKAPEFDPWG
ncbi:uncharacterized protein LOC142590120 [Dermacentor variabilis]|uniref:uncharacterized protein LOC142590120 n=1 Tax=Dermacentor variabilis TaxID=34621 RepID=UPI003F5B4BF9